MTIPWEEFFAEFFADMRKGFRRMPIMFGAPDEKGESKELPIFKVGARVIKREGDYTFEGEVVAVFYKRGGKALRYVVEDYRGVCMIMSPRQLDYPNPGDR